MHTRKGYVIGVLIAWAIILSFARLYASPEHFRSLYLVGSGFVLGMFSAFIAVAV